MFHSSNIFYDVSIKCKPVIVDINSIYCLNAKHQLSHIISGKNLVLNENKFNWLFKLGANIYCFEEKELKTLVLETSTDKYIYWNFVANPWEQNHVKALNEMIFFVRESGLFYFALIKINDGKILKRIHIENQIKKALTDSKNVIAVVQKENDFLQCYSTEGNLCWEKKLQEMLGPGDTRQTGNLILSNGDLYIVLESAFERKKATYVIDVETGKILSQFDNLAGSYHIEDGIVFKAYGYSVDRIDTRTNTLIHDNFEDILKPENLWIHDDTSILTEDALLYFYDGATIGGNRVGVLDLKSHKLLWQAKLKIKSRYKSIRSMQLHDDILYVHADDDTLHVFEK